MKKASLSLRSVPASPRHPAARRHRAAPRHRAARHPSVFFGRSCCVALGTVAGTEAHAQMHTQTLTSPLVAGQIRNFLWNQPYISRFNEEGKK